MAWLADVDAARWMRITAGAHDWNLWAEIVDAQHTTLPTPPLPIASADLTVAGGTIRHSGRVTIPAEADQGRGVIDWAPNGWDDIITPFGNRLRLHMKVTNGDETQTVDLGLWLIMSVSRQHPGNELVLELGDVAHELVQARVARDIPTGDQAGWSQKRLCQHVVNLAGVPRRPDLKDPQGWLSLAAIPNLPVFNAGSSAWDLLQELAGLVDETTHVYVDRNGNLRVWRQDLSETLPPPDTARLSLSDGEGGHLIALRSSLSRVNAVNAVSVIVEDTFTEGGAGGADQSAVSAALTPPPQATAGQWSQQQIVAAYLQTIAETVRRARAEIGVSRAANGTIKYQFAFPQYGSMWVEYCGIFCAWLLGPVMSIPTPVAGRNWVSLLAYVPTAKRDLAPYIKQVPRVGDIVLFNWEHVGMVVDTSNWPNWVDTVEGNVGNRVVALRRYPSAIFGGRTPGGFVSPDYTRLSGLSGTAGPPVRAGVLQAALNGDWRVMRDEGDPADTSQTGYAFAVGGGPLDFNTGTLGRATVVEVVSRKDPARGWAQDRAVRLLDASKGAPRTLSAQTTPQPWLNPYDVVEIRVGGRGEKVRVAGWQLTADDQGRITFQLEARGWHAYTQTGAGLPRGEVVGA